MSGQYFQLLIEGAWREKYKKESKVAAGSDMYIDIKNCVNVL